MPESVRGYCLCFCEIFVVVGGVRIGNGLDSKMALTSCVGFELTGGITCVRLTLYTPMNPQVPYLLCAVCRRNLPLSPTGMFRMTDNSRSRWNLPTSSAFRRSGTRSRSRSDLSSRSDVILSGERGKAQGGWPDPASSFWMLGLGGSG